MKRGKIKEILLILMFLFLINVPCSTADESSLKVEISQKGSIEENEFFNGLFVVSTQITNIGKEDQTINEWSCSYGLSWAANIPEILTGLEMCARNVPGNITLKPNETYTRDLSISVNADADQKLLTFSLGFNPTEDLNWRSSDTDIHKGSLIWSNPLTIDIPSWMKIKESLNRPRKAQGGVTVINNNVELEDMDFEVRKLLASSGGMDIPLPELEGITREQCQDRGGIWGRLGSRKGEICNLPTEDAKRSCETPDDCQGDCKIEFTQDLRDKIRKGEVKNIYGQCSEWMVDEGFTPLEE